MREVKGTKRSIALSGLVSPENAFAILTRFVTGHPRGSHSGAILSPGTLAVRTLGPFWPSDPWPFALWDRFWPTDLLAVRTLGPFWPTDLLAVRAPDPFWPANNCVTSRECPGERWQLGNKGERALVGRV